MATSSQYPKPGPDITNHAGEAPPIPARPAPDRFYRPELDWLRFFAFCLVFLLHGFARETGDYTALGVPLMIAEFAIVPLVNAGGYGVDLFFTLSAFLITQLLLLERDRTGTVHIRSFYLRRILRIWPLYFAFVLVAYAYEFAFTDNPLTYYISLLFFVCNWFAVFFTEPLTVTSHLWSVSVEEQFYVVWPLLLARAKPPRFIAILAAMFAFTCAFRVLCIYWAWPDASPVWHNTLTHLDGFALGGLLACLLHKRNVRLWIGLRALLFVVAFAIYWRLGLYPSAGYFWIYPAWTYPLAALASVLCIFVFLTSTPKRAIAKPMRALSYLGKISYGLYVFHLPAIHFAEWQITAASFPQEWLWIARMACAALATLAAAAASYTVLERPFLRLKRRFTYVESRPA